MQRGPFYGNINEMFESLCCGTGREVIYDPSTDGSFRGAVGKGMTNPVKNPFAHWKFCHPQLHLDYKETNIACVWMQAGKGCSF